VRLVTKIESIELNVIDFQDGSIVSSHLSVNAKVNGITEADFQELVTKAEKNCPISKLLNIKITSEAVLA
jgi:osmotically inducible protein OsmC